MSLVRIPLAPPWKKKQLRIFVAAFSFLLYKCETQLVVVRIVHIAVSMALMITLQFFLASSLIFFSFLFFVSRKGGEALFEVCSLAFHVHLRTSSQCPQKSIPALLNSSPSPLRQEQRRFFEAYAKIFQPQPYKNCTHSAWLGVSTFRCVFALCVAKVNRCSLWWSVKACSRKLAYWWMY